MWSKLQTHWDGTAQELNLWDQGQSITIGEGEELRVEISRKGCQ